MAVSLQEIFDRLLSCYGPQHWWPARTRFEVMVGAILTQSAAWTNVEKAIERLQEADALSPGALRRLPEAELAGLIRPSGYYNAKARKLKAFVEWLGARCDDDLNRLFAEETATLREELLAVHGIGEETADSILLYAGGKPVFVIDAYTRRITDRLGFEVGGTGYADYQRFFMEHLPHEAALFNEYHALLVEHGKTACRKQPLCDDCCLQDLCRYAHCPSGT